MRSRSDDELYSLQNRYLGPPGRTFIFQARYAAYGIWAACFFVLLVIKQQLGLFSGFMGYVVVALFATLATQAVMRVITPERPAGQVLRMFGAELSTPRPLTRVRTVGSPDPRHVQVAVARPIPEDDR
ncbi:MAG: hypothetical protein L0I76_17520 [Pseudonocardia sp.]|nr:hypothetical protein [Pseudonocardia sp.]